MSITLIAIVFHWNAGEETSGCMACSQIFYQRRGTLGKGSIYMRLLSTVRYNHTF